MTKIKKYLLLISIILMALSAMFFTTQKTLDPIFRQQAKIVHGDSLKSKTINKYEDQKPKIQNVNPKMVSVDKTDVEHGFMKEIGGVVYVGTYDKGLMRLDEKTKKLVLVDKTSVSGGFIEEIGGVVYVGTCKKGLMRLDEKTNKLVLVDGTDVEAGFMKKIGGVVYVGTRDKGLMRLDEKTQKLVLVDGTIVRDGFMEEIGGVVYVRTRGMLGIYSWLMRLDEKTNKLVKVDGTRIMGGIEFIKKIGGVVYVGTNNNGLMILDKKMNKLVKVDGTKAMWGIGGFMEEIGGVVYVGTGSFMGMSNGLMRLDEKTKKLVLVDKTNVIFMKEIGGVVYVGTGKGLKRLDFTNIQNENGKFLKQIFKDVKIQNQGFISVSDVAKKINDINSLKKYTGIEIPKLNRYSTLKLISATSDPKTGIVNLKIILNVGSGEQTINIPLQGKSDDAIKEIIANNDQKSSKKIIEDILKKSNAYIINQGTIKVSNIASTIKNIATLKNITGIDLSNLVLNNSVISSISAVGNTKGVLTILIKIFTKNATQQELKISKDIQGKSDMKVDAEIATEKADEKQPLNIAKFKEQFNTNKKLLHQNIKTVGDIAKEINSGYDIEYKISVINKWLNNNLSKYMDGTEITNIHAKPYPKTGRIKITITTHTKNATNSEQAFETYVSGMSDLQVVKLIANIENNKPSGIKKGLLIIIGSIGGGLLVLGEMVFFTINRIKKRKN